MAENCFIFTHIVLSNYHCIKPVMLFQLTVTVTEIGNNWKIMNQLTVTATEKCQ